MTEQEINAAAERFGLKVEKRIGTGTPAKGFADFSLCGPADMVRAAWPEIRAQAAAAGFHRDFCQLAHVDNPDHEDYGQPYIEIQSVWFETADK